ncbi:MAG: dockerin type I domain-containing protein, partial [Chloroflexota bacterium]
FLLKWGKEGRGDGEFNSPIGIAADGSGHVYVVDWLNNRIQKFDAQGNFLARWGRIGQGNGEFNLPVGISVDGSGHIYVVDYGNGRIQGFADPSQHEPEVCDGQDNDCDGQVDEGCCTGDMNGDGTITPVDALLVFRCYLGMTACPACADVNRDGAVTPVDALCLFRKYLGQPSCLDTVSGS